MIVIAKRVSEDTQNKAGFAQSKAVEPENKGKPVSADGKPERAGRGRRKG